MGFYNNRLIRFLRFHTSFKCWEIVGKHFWKWMQFTLIVINKCQNDNLTWDWPDCCCCGEAMILYFKSTEETEYWHWLTWLASQDNWIFRFFLSISAIFVVVWILVLGASGGGGRLVATWYLSLEWRAECLYLVNCVLVMKLLKQKLSTSTKIWLLCFQSHLITETRKCLCWFCWSFPSSERNKHRTCKYRSSTLGYWIIFGARDKL